MELSAGGMKSRAVDDFSHRCSRKRRRSAMEGEEGAPPPSALAPPKREMFYAVRSGTLTSSSSSGRGPVAVLRSAIFLRLEDAWEFVADEDNAEYEAFESVEEASAYLRETINDENGGVEKGRCTLADARDKTTTAMDMNSDFGWEGERNDSMAPKNYGNGYEGPVVVVARKVTQETKLGIGLKDQAVWINGKLLNAAIVSQITEDSPLNNTALKVGMAIESINGTNCSSSEIAFMTMKMIGMEVKIVAREATPALELDGKNIDDSPHASDNMANEEVFSECTEEVKCIISQFKDDVQGALLNAVNVRLASATDESVDIIMLKSSMNNLKDELLRKMAGTDFKGSDNQPLESGPRITDQSSLALSQIQFMCKGTCLCIPKSFKFPTSPTRLQGWRLWLQGSIHVNGKHVWRIKPYRKLTGKDLPSQQLKNAFKLAWKPIFTTMMEAPGLTLPENDDDIDEASVLSSFEVTTQYLKDRFSYIFKAPESWINKYSLNTWSCKIRSNRVKKYGTKEDIHRLPPATYRNRPHNSRRSFKQNRKNEKAEKDELPDSVPDNKDSNLASDGNLSIENSTLNGPGSAKLIDENKASPFVSRTHAIDQAARFPGPFQFEYKGSCWCVPESFQFPPAPTRLEGWTMWLRGAIHVDGTQKWKIKPYRKFISKDLHSIKLKRTYTHHWCPIFNAMMDAPGLSIPKNEGDIDQAFILNSFDVATEYLKTRFSYIFNASERWLSRYSIGTWSKKISPREVKKFGTEEDIRKLTPPESRNKSHRKTVIFTQEKGKWKNEEENEDELQGADDANMGSNVAAVKDTNLTIQQSATMDSESEEMDTTNSIKASGASPSDPRMQTADATIRVPGPYEFVYKGKCWFIPESFKFPSTTTRRQGWKMWLQGSVHVHGTQTWKIPPYRKLRGKDLHSDKLKNAYKLDWNPIFTKMMEAPGLTIPENEAEIDDEFLQSSYDLTTEYLKSRFSYIFTAPQSSLEKLRIGTWSKKTSPNIVRKYGTKSDISKLPPPKRRSISQDQAKI